LSKKEIYLESQISSQSFIEVGYVGVKVHKVTFDLRILSKDDGVGIKLYYSYLTMSIALAFVAFVVNKEHALQKGKC